MGAGKQIAQPMKTGAAATWRNNAERGRYRLTFVIGAYFAQLGRSSIYPEIAVTFECGGDGHYHLPLLLSDNSYTTYRGS